MRDTAGLVSGVLKVYSAFAFATVIALAPSRSLRVLGLLSWVSLGVSVAGAFAAIPWGLVGVLYGISLGWLIRALAATWLALPYLRRAAPAGRDGGSVSPRPTQWRRPPHRPPQ